MTPMIDEELTGQIIKTFYKVYNSLGHGFIERVYHNAMILELVRSGIAVETEKPIAVYYDDKVVGAFSADLVVEGKIILELKSKETCTALTKPNSRTTSARLILNSALYSTLAKKPSSSENTFRTRINVEQRLRRGRRMMAYWRPFSEKMIRPNPPNPRNPRLKKDSRLESVKSTVYSAEGD